MKNRKICMNEIEKKIFGKKKVRRIGNHRMRVHGSSISNIILSREIF